MYAVITISEENAKKLYEVDELKRQEACFKLYKEGVKPESLLNEKPTEPAKEGTFNFIVDTDIINALFRRPDYENAKKKKLSEIFKQQAREKFGPTEEEKKKELEEKEAEKKAGVAASPVKEVEAKKIKKKKEKGETPIIYVIPRDDDSDELDFDTVTDSFYEKEHCCCDKGFHEELREEYDWTDEEITKIENRLEKLGFNEGSENTWTIEGAAGKALTDKIGHNLKKILVFLNSSKVFPFIFEHMTRAKFEEKYDEEDDEDGIGWEDEDSEDSSDDAETVCEIQDTIIDALDDLPKCKESIDTLKDLKARIERQLKEWGA